MDVQVVRQKDKLKINDFQQIVERCDVGERAGKRRHGPLLPRTIRCLVCGPSNCGKTNVVFNLLFDPNGLRFSNVYVFSKSLYQPKYVMLEKVMAEVPEIGYFPFRENEEVIAPENAEPYSVMIFDDVSCERQNNIRKYFAMGRHNEIDSFLVGQTYSSFPKQLVRDNANLLVLFKQDERNMRHAYNDHVNTDMTFDAFKMVCAKAWKGDKYGFLVVDKDSDVNGGRYRIGFDKFITNVESAF